MFHVLKHLGKFMQMRETYNNAKTGYTIRWIDEDNEARIVPEEFTSFEDAQRYARRCIRQDIKYEILNPKGHVVTSQVEDHNSEEF